MTKIFSLGSISYSILYPLFLSFFCFGHNVAKGFFLLSNREEIELYTIILVIIRTLALLSFGIITLISNKCFWKYNKIKETKINVKKLMIFLLIILLTIIFQFVSIYFATLFNFEKPDTYIFIPICKVLQLIITKEL